MKRVKIGPGVWAVDPLGEIVVTEEVRRQYIEAGLTPPKLVDNKAYPTRPAGEPQAVRLAIAKR
jgi:hypothetical protein